MVPGDSRRVVAEGGQSLLADIQFLGHDVQLGCYTRLLQVAVGELPRRVILGHHLALDVTGEGFAPEVGLVVIAEEDPTHARLGGVNPPEVARLFRDDLGKARGPFLEAEGERLEVVQEGTDVPIDAHAIVGGLFEAEL